MPAVSAKQRIAMAIAEHHPEQLYARNRGMLSMSHQQLHDFASTKGLHKKKKRKSAMARARESLHRGG